MALRVQLFDGQRVAHRQPGQAHLPVLELGLGVIRPLDVSPQETRERNNPSVGGKLGILAGRANRPQAHLQLTGPGHRTSAKRRSAAR